MSKKFELSLWRDYPGEQEIKEEKVCVIASDSMNQAGQAQNITLMPSYTGEINLSFDLPAKYFDITEQKQIINPLGQQLQVKSKIKLWREEHWYNKYANPEYDSDNQIWKFTPQWENSRWYDFIVNTKTEKRSKKALIYSYECVSLFVNELSRTGYHLEFKSDGTDINEQSIGTAHQLAEKITKDTDWTYLKSEIFPDYKSVFNVNTGEVEKIPVSTDQIDFLDGLKRYAYCYNYHPEDKTKVEEVLTKEQKLGHLIAGQAGFENGKFYWYRNSADIGKEDKKLSYIQGYNKTSYITAYAEKYLAEESGMYKDGGYTGISLMNDLAGGWVNENHKDLGVSSVKTGTGLGSSVVRYYRTLDFSLYNTFYNLNCENTRIPCGTLLAIKLAGETTRTFTFSIYEGKDWTTDTGYGSPAVQVQVEATTGSLPFEQTYYLRVPATIEKPHFAIGCNIELNYKFSGILVYKLVGYTEEYDELFNQVYTQFGKITDLGSLQVFKDKGITPAILQINSLNNSPIWLPLGKITTNDYSKDINEYLIETYISGNYYQIYLPANDMEISKITSYDTDKRRAISGEKSNRFSLLTAVCETFKCFFKFIVVHNQDGTIKKDKYGNWIKYYTLISTLGNNQFNGFTYGVNLDEVSRKADATNLVSKLYVEPIDNQYANTGLVSIQQSKYNELRENFIYNFGYYLLRGLIDKNTFNTDYARMRNFVSKTNLKLEQLNADYLEIKNKKQELDNEVYTLKATQLAMVSTVQKCLEDINWTTFTGFNECNNSTKDKMIVLVSGLGKDVNNLTADWSEMPYRVYRRNHNALDNYEGMLYGKKVGGTYQYKIINGTTEVVINTLSSASSFTDWYDNSKRHNYLLGNGVYVFQRIQEFPNIDISNMVALITIGGAMPMTYSHSLNNFKDIATFCFNNKFLLQTGNFTRICGVKEETIVNTLEVVSSYQEKYKQYGNTIALDNNALDGSGEQKGYNTILKEKSDEIESLTTAKNRSIANFEKKYSQYIIEGTWKGDSYVDNDIYYLDATQTGAESCMPKVEYDVNVIDISAVANPLNPLEKDWGKDFSYDVGDTTYIKDYELFGNVEQKSMIAEKTIYVDTNQPDDISLRNYDTRFEELFESISATVLSLKYNEDIYGRASNFTADGAIDTSILQKSFDQNKQLVMSSNNNKIIQDEYGITIRDADGSTGNILKLIAGAILISKDNGLSYTAGLTADGFNGALITAGEIDTSKVVIRSSETPSLQLDELGLTAYRVYNSDDEHDSSGRAIKSDGTIGTYLPIVRHDQFGFYLAKEGTKFGKDWYKDIDNPENFIEENAQIAITQLGVSLQSEDGIALKLINNVRQILIGQDDSRNNIYTNWGSCVGSFDKEGDYYIPRVRLGYIRDDNGSPVHGLDIYGGSLRLYGKKFRNDLTDDDASLYFKTEDGKTNMYLNSRFIRTDLYNTDLRIGDYGGRLMFSSSYEASSDKYNSLQFAKWLYNSKTTNPNNPDSTFTFGLQGGTDVALQQNASISYLHPTNSTDVNARLHINCGYIDSLSDEGTDFGSQIWITAGRLVTVKDSTIKTMNHFSRIILIGNSTGEAYGNSSAEIESDYILLNGSGRTDGKAVNITLSGVSIQFNGTVSNNSSSGTQSDQMRKHDIDGLSANYSSFFDKLTPRIYKYNDGTSGRTHVGFIAQEVNKALDNSGLTLTDFASPMLVKDKEGNEYWTLRYEEFIALNTFEIQKLKAKVSELESKLNSLTSSN